VIEGAVRKIGEQAGSIVAKSPIYVTRPLGPSLRDYCNAAVILETHIAPLPLLAMCKRIEKNIGRRSGRVWGARPIDIDIILWSEGTITLRHLVIPHRQWMQRRFVCDPVCAIAPEWRVPGQARRVRHIAYRLRHKHTNSR
jgi:2-amino-4-hydroxy-6-hydroxymethyldihydropteridine diphosphokinase